MRAWKIKLRLVWRLAMDSIEYVGLVASSLATLAFLPQVSKTLRTGSAYDFSLITLLMIEAGTSIWIYYGVLRAAPAIWLGNGVTFALVGLILSVKIRNLLSYRNQLT
jgi:MtN3 and saliva related transmembrane protein